MRRHIERAGHLGLAHGSELARSHPQRRGRIPNLLGASSALSAPKEIKHLARANHRRHYPLCVGSEGSQPHPATGSLSKQIDAEFIGWRCHGLPTR